MEARGVHGPLTRTRFPVYFSRAKSAECEGVSRSEEAEVSIPGGAGGRPREGSARPEEGAGDGESRLEILVSPSSTASRHFPRCLRPLHSTHDRVLPSTRLAPRGNRCVSKNFLIRGY